MLWMVVAALTSSSVSIDNFVAGEKVTYPLVILRGRADGNAVEVRNTTTGAAPLKFDVVDGRFIGLAELRPGGNRLQFSDGSTLDLTYEKPTSTHRVEVTLVLAADDPDGYDDGQGGLATDYRERMDVAMKLLQSVAAEQMRDGGYGRKTFTLDFLPSGMLNLQVRRLPQTGSELRAKEGGELWSMLHDSIATKTDTSKVKHCIVMGFTRWDREAKKAHAHTALGGGSLGLFGGGSMYTWPKNLADVTRVFTDTTILGDTGLDDSAGRSTVWGSASTTLGATLHEMGHAFGLPHSDDPYCIMTRGFDRFNRHFTIVEPVSRRNAEPIRFTSAERSRWCAWFAARLNVNPWFQSADPPNVARRSRPQIRVDREAGTVTVESPNGLAIVGAWRDDRPIWFEPFPAYPVTPVVLSIDTIQAKVQTTDRFNVVATDRYGLESSVDIRFDQQTR